MSGDDVAALVAVLGALIAYGAPARDAFEWVAGFGMLGAAAAVALLG